MGMTENSELVRRTWDAFVRGDVKAAFANCADDVTWKIPGAPRAWKRTSWPTTNSGGPIQASRVPSWSPSIMRGMEPIWLAG